MEKMDLNRDDKSNSIIKNDKTIWGESGLRRERWYGYYFLIPGMTLIAVLISVPLLRALWTSLHRVRGFRSTFIGLNNYLYLLSKPDFWHSLKTSVLFTAVCVASHMLFGLCLALLLNRIVRGKTLMRVGFLAPWIVAPSIGAIIWIWLLEPQFGVVNHILSSLGLIDGFMAWLGEPELAFLSVIVVDVWRGTPFVMLILLAGLQGIPKEQYEAAAMDGAGPWQQFRHVTLPNLHYLLVVASTLDIISTIRHFDVISVMTGGGPVRATEVLPVMIYNTAFVQNDFGRASAAGIMLLGVILIFSAFYLKATKPGKARED